jgi:hypothetical protein
MEGWWRKGVATALVGAVVLVALTLWRQPQPTVLESAILPPRAFRRWFYETTHRTKGPVNEVPLDRFAGRGRGRRAAATVPGYLDKEANQVGTLAHAAPCRSFFCLSPYARAHFRIPKHYICYYRHASSIRRTWPSSHRRSRS